MIEIENIIRKIAIWGIIIILSYSIYCIIINTHTTFVRDGIRLEGNSEYPHTNNPFMEGVTSQEYTAEIK